MFPLFIPPNYQLRIYNLNVIISCLYNYFVTKEIATRLFAVVLLFIRTEILKQEVVSKYKIKKIA